MKKILAPFILLYTSLSIDVSAEYKFPDSFRFGVSSSAYQIEGGWNASGKGESIWDRLAHTRPEVFKDRSNGDVACDSYNLWETDVKLLKNLGVDYYRFSLSWPRLLPYGYSSHINSDGVKYYNKLINSLLKNKIEPIITLYHWDLPQGLQDLGGWANLKTADYFAEYARVAFSLFGDRVKTWITLNEPYQFCHTYHALTGAPMIRSPGIGIYLCGKTVLIAHSKAYHIYEEEFREKQGGKIGISIDAIWPEPASNKTEDVEAAERELQIHFGWWVHPIFSKDGDYPDVMKKRIQHRSFKENFPESRLPSFTKDELKKLKRSADFLGINHYFTFRFRDFNFPIDEPSYDKDKGTMPDMDPNWNPHVAKGFYKLLKWIKKEYNNPPVFITENGFSDNGQLQDSGRINYIKEIMRSVLDAMAEGCNIQSYTVWSFMDSMEWTLGYTAKLGLIHVDFSSPSRKRTPKASSKFFTNVIKTRKIPENITMFLDNSMNLN